MHSATTRRHPPAERAPLFFHLRPRPVPLRRLLLLHLLLRLVAAQRGRGGRRKREGERKRRTEMGCFAIRVCPRIPERRLSPLPLNIHPLGKPDKNKEKTRPTIPPHPLPPSLRYTVQVRSTACPQHVGNLISNSEMCARCI